MRTFANFLYVGNLYNSIPGAEPEIINMYNRLFKPVLTIVEEDCGTRLGVTEAIVPSSISSETVCGETTTTSLSSFLVGKVELGSPDFVITPAVVSGYIQQIPPRKYVKVRSLSSCTSVGGVCRKCLWASYDIYDPTFDRSQVDLQSDYPDINTGLVGATQYRIIPQIVPGQPLPKVQMDFTVDTSPFLSYISKTYSGSILGMRTYLNDRLPIREGLYQDTLLKEGVVAQFVRKIIDSGFVLPNELEYGKNIDNPLEKVLFLLGQYNIGFYFNGQN